MKSNLIRFISFALMLLLIGLSGPADAQSQPGHGWGYGVYTWGSNSSEEALDVAVTPDGHSYVTGYFVWTTSYDIDGKQTDFTSDGYFDAYLTRLDPDGNVIWMRHWGCKSANGFENGLNYARGFGVASDSHGNAIITGFFLNDFDLDPGPAVVLVSAKGNEDIFLIKVDPTGNVIWAKTWGGPGWDDGIDVEVDSDDNIIVTGTFERVVDMDPGERVDNKISQGSSDAFLSKFSPDGDLLWSRTWGGVAQDLGIRLAVDREDNVHVVGRFQHGVDFDPGKKLGEVWAEGGYDVSVSKFDPSGMLLWARNWGGAGDDFGNGVAVDADGNVFVAGNFAETVDFDPGPAVDSRQCGWGEQNTYLSKLDKDGNYQWARTWLGRSGKGVAIGNDGDVYMVGGFVGQIDMNPGPGENELTNPGAFEDHFLERLTNGGEFVWALGWGSTTGESIWGVDIDSSGNIYATGDFASTVDFNPGPGEDIRTSKGSLDCFISKFSPDGVYLWATTWGGAGSGEMY